MIGTAENIPVTPGWGPNNAVLGEIVVGRKILPALPAVRSLRELRNASNTDAALPPLHSQNAGCTKRTRPLGAVHSARTRSLCP